MLRRCARRLGRLRAPAVMILTARGEGRGLAHVAWIAISCLLLLALDPAPLGWWALPTLLLFVSLVAVSLFDARYLLIPDGPLALLLACGVALALMGSTSDMADRFAAAACAYSALWLVAFGYERLRGRAGLGLADAKLFALAGLWLGIGALPGCLTIAVASALVSALVAARDGGAEMASRPIPFGPHLALGFWLSWSLGPLEFG